MLSSRQLTPPTLTRSACRARAAEPTTSASLASLTLPTRAVLSVAAPEALGKVRHSDRGRKRLAAQSRKSPGFRPRYAKSPHSVSRGGLEHKGSCSMVNTGRTDHLIDLTGKRFGRLVVVARAPKEKGVKPRWACQCDCGAVSTVDGACLRTGNTLSCGCLAAEGMHRTHGRSRTPTHVVWSHMLARCRNKRLKCWKNYGGRGIKVCDRWQGREGFRHFLDDMGERPSPQHSIERTDVNGDYEPSNCVWATAVAQSNNRRNNHRVTHNGETRTFSEWGRISAISPQLIRTRYVRYGWDFERALRTPPLFSPRRK